MERILKNGGSALNPEKVQARSEAASLYLEGKSLAEIAALLKVSAPTVRAWLLKLSIPMRKARPRGYSPEKRAQIVAAYKNGSSIRAVARIHHLREVTVRSWLKAAGVPLRERGFEVRAENKVSNSTISAWAKLYSQGTSAREIAGRYGTTLRTVTHLLRLHGQQIRKPGAPEKVKMPPVDSLRAAYEEHHSIEKIAHHYAVTAWTVQRWFALCSLESGDRGMRPISPQEYFDARTPTRPTDGCWPWEGTMMSSGYGKATVEIGGRVQTIGAHKLSYILHKAAVPRGQVVRHLCNNRRCCNPQHLVTGTHQDNANDRIAAGVRGDHRDPTARHRQCRNNMDRLLSRIKKDESTGCWLWTGGQRSSGYGLMVWTPRNPDEPRSMTTHRASYLLHRGSIPDGLIVRHLCHQKLCCNPAHLELGTIADNVRDEIEAGRIRRGTTHPRTAMTEELVLKMRDLRAAGLTHRQLSQEFGTSMGSVAAITSGRTWAHVGGPLTPSRSGPGSSNPAAMLSEADVLEIRRTYSSGEATIKQLADRFGVTQGTVAHILHRRTWRHL